MNWKTTLGAIITLVAGLCKVFGINVPEDVTTAAMTVGTFIIGLFAKDHNKL